MLRRVRVSKPLTDPTGGRAGREYGVVTWGFRAGLRRNRGRLGVCWFNFSMLNYQVRVWLPLSVLAGVSTVAVYLFGVSSQAWDISETCERHAQAYDEAYRAEHWREPGRWFPLHDKCNAYFDLVPVWVNPAVVILATVTVACAVVSMVAIGTKINRSAPRG